MPGITLEDEVKVSETPDAGTAMGDGVVRVTPVGSVPSETVGVAVVPSSAAVSWMVKLVFA